MLFNSIEFLIFFCVVVGAYFLIANRFRWMLLLAASYAFYMSWNPSYVLLILPIVNGLLMSFNTKFNPLKKHTLCK